jgi:hypothetical protein
LYRLVLDDTKKILQITPTKATTPIRRKSSSTLISFCDISAINYHHPSENSIIFTPTTTGGGGGGLFSRKKMAKKMTSIKDPNEKTYLVITTTNKKVIEFEMRFPEEREQLFSYIKANTSMR